MASVDVVVPCYNYGRYLRDCVDSILSQGLEDVRILIIDNASTDDSAAVALQLAKENAAIEVIVHDNNLGPQASYNEGIDWAQAKYMLILDADDLLAPNCLQHAVAILEEQPEVVFTHGEELRLAFPAGVIPKPDQSQRGPEWHIASGMDVIDCLSRFPVNHVDAPTVVRRTSAQKKAGYYRAELPYTDDLELWLRLAMLGDVAETTRVQAVRRLHDARASVEYQSAQEMDFVERKAAFDSFFSKEGRHLPQASLLQSLTHRRLAHHAYWSAISHFLRGYPATAWNLLMFASKHDPSVVLVPPIGWLFRMDGPFKRAAEILLEARRSRLGIR